MDIIVSVLGLLTSAWFVFALFANLASAGGTYIDEVLTRKYEQPIGVQVIVTGLFGFVLVGIFGTTAVLTQENLNLPLTTIAQAMGVGVLEQLYTIPLLYAIYRRGAMVVGPMTQLVPVITLGFGGMFGIMPPAMQIGGALLIVAGGIILSIEKPEDEDDAKIDWITLGLAGLSSLLVALIYVLFNETAESDDMFVAVGFWSGLGMGLAGITIWAVYRPYREVFNDFCRNANKEALGLQLANEALDAGGTYFMHKANLLGPSVMVVTATGAIEPLAIGIIGFLFGIKHASDKEASSWSRVIAISIAIIAIAGGVVLVSV